MLFSDLSHLCVQVFGCPPVKREKGEKPPIKPSSCWYKGKLPESIKGLSADSRLIESQFLFTVLRNSRGKEHLYIQEAIKRGANTLVVEEEDKGVSFSGLILKVPDTKLFFSALLKASYGCPSHKMLCFGVTGTNGKTSVSFMLEHLLSACGYKTGLIGTIGYRLGGNKQTFCTLRHHLTTPQQEDLYALLNHFVKERVGATVMEVSSHGILQGRAKGVDFNSLIFTNLSPDHLDYHGSMEKYYQAKSLLFQALHPRLVKVGGSATACKAIINVDDLFGRRLVKQTPFATTTYGSFKKASKAWDYSWEILNETLDQITFSLVSRKTHQRWEGVLPLLGAFNVENAVAALLAIQEGAGPSIDQTLPLLKTFLGVPGRLERVANRPLVFIDYAHTPVALERVLQCLFKFKQQVREKKRRLITLFGCGGDRDKTKRPLMLEVAYTYSDLVILSTDNPRTEAPAHIVKECLEGKKAYWDIKKIQVELDREKAIHKALQAASSQDIVLIAGKGHERVQILNNKSLPFSDKDIVQTLLR